MEYKFGKGLVAVSVYKNTITVSKLQTRQKQGTTIEGKTNSTIELSFTSVSAIDKMITDLKLMRAGLVNKKIKELLEVL